MKIVSARVGEIEIGENDIISFPEGIIGFPSITEYVEIDFLEESPLRLLQAVQEPGLGFIITDPHLFLPTYTVEVSRSDLERLKVTSKAELHTRAIVTIPEDPYEMTANLQGPLLFNPDQRIALQVAMNDGSYGTKHKVLQNPEPHASAVS